MSYTIDASDARQTDRLRLSERLYVTEENASLLPVAIEGSGFHFTRVNDRTYENLKVGKITETGGTGDCIRCFGCNDLVFSGCELNGQLDECVDIKDCGLVVFEDCIIGPGNTAATNGMDSAALVQQSEHVIFRNCVLEGQVRCPAVYDSLVTLDGCTIGYGWEGVGLYGSRARINIINGTEFHNVRVWDSQVKAWDEPKPERTPVRLNFSGFDRSFPQPGCIHWPQLWREDDPTRLAQLVVGSDLYPAITNFFSSKELE